MRLKTLSFTVSLIESLKEKGFVSSAVMLPLLVGAYQIKDGRSEPIDYNYLKITFKKILDELYYSNHCLFLRECESSHNFVLEVCTNTQREHNLKISVNNKVVIYCMDPLYNGNDIEENSQAVNFLIDKYIAVIGKYCNFSDKESTPTYPHMRELCINKYIPEVQLSEFDVIKALVDNMPVL